jgi:hypothetical protein
MPPVTATNGSRAVCTALMPLLFRVAVPSTPEGRVTDGDYIE